MADTNPPLLAEIQEAQILKNLRPNTVYNILDGAFFGFAIGFASFMTIIPLFISTLTGSAILIGMIPAIHNMGWQLPQLLIANRVSRQRRYKPMVLKVTIHERLPYLGLAVLAWFSPYLGVHNALVLAFILLIWQGLGSGFTAAPWQSMIARIFPADRRGTFYGAQSSAANLLASLSAILAGFILSNLVSPLDFTLCFTFASIWMTVSWLALAMTREPARQNQPAPVDTGTFWKNIARILREDTNFRWFLVVRMLSQIAVMGFSFYTVYTVKFLGMPEVTIGIMTGVLMATSIVANPVMGWLGDRWGHRSIMAFGMLAAAASGLLAWLVHDPKWFYLVFVLAAFANVANWTIPLAMIPQFASEPDRPSYIGMANTFIAPVTVLAPLLGGLLAEVAGYPSTFLVSAVGGLVTAAFLQAKVRNPHQQSKTRYSPKENV